MPPSPFKILSTQALSADLASQFTRPVEFITLDGRPDEEVRERLDDADALVSGLYKPSWQRETTKRPLLVQCVGAGIDGITLTSLPRRSTVCNVYGHAQAVAERAFLHMLALNQGLLGLDRDLRQGNWTPQRAYLPELRDKSLLVLGLGHIGRELVRWGKFFGMKVSVLTRNAPPERAAGLDLVAFGPLTQLADHLPAADFVVIAIPSAEGTVGLIGPAKLKLMKSTAFIINVGRGPVIDEDALYHALLERRIGGAGLDVWWQYPKPGDRICQPSSRPFHELDNVVMTPHKPTQETMTWRIKAIAANIERFAAGQALENVVWQHGESR
jgi:phosphoglycerate dehydrogenase-like enzyme